MTSRFCFADNIYCFYCCCFICIHTACDTAWANLIKRGIISVLIKWRIYAPDWLLCILILMRMREITKNKYIHIIIFSSYFHRRHLNSVPLKCKMKQKLASSSAHSMFVLRSTQFIVLDVSFRLAIETTKQRNTISGSSRHQNCLLWFFFCVFFFVFSFTRNFTFYFGWSSVHLHAKKSITIAHTLFLFHLNRMTTAADNQNKTKKNDVESTADFTRYFLLFFGSRRNK